MKRRTRIGMNAIVISAALTSPPMNGLGIDVGRADPTPAGTKSAAQQAARKQQANAIRASRAAERRLARQIAVAQADGWLDPSVTVVSFSPLSTAGSSGMGFTSGFSGGGALFPAMATPAPGTLTGTSSGSLAGATAGTSQTSSAGQVSPTYNAKTLQFAVDHLGQQVGNGECWTLAADALVFAGAKPADGYVFGAEIPLSSAQPGDILQFTSAVFSGAAYWMQMGFPHHTAIVDSVQGTSMVVLNQNFNNVRRVQTTLINFADMKSGSVIAYRAVAPDQTTDGTAP